MTHEYENFRRVVYGDDNATFVPACPKCGRFIKADGTITFHFEGGPKEQPNATCKKCGRVQMPFEGFI